VMPVHIRHQSLWRHWFSMHRPFPAPRRSNGYADLAVIIACHRHSAASRFGDIIESFVATFTNISATSSSEGETCASIRLRYGQMSAAMGASDLRGFAGLLPTRLAMSRRYDAGSSLQSCWSACLPCRRQTTNKSVVEASLRQSRGGRPGPPACPLTKRPRTSRKTGRTDGVATVSSCAAAPYETCRLILALRATINA